MIILLLPAQQQAEQVQAMLNPRPLGNGNVNFCCLPLPDARRSEFLVDSTSERD